MSIGKIFHTNKKVPYWFYILAAIFSILWINATKIYFFITMGLFGLNFHTAEGIGFISLWILPYGFIALFVILLIKIFSDKKINLEDKIFSVIVAIGSYSWFLGFAIILVLLYAFVIGLIQKKIFSSLLAAILIPIIIVFNMVLPYNPYAFVSNIENCPDGRCECKFILENNTPELINSIEGRDLRDSCFSKYVMKYDQPEFCSQISNKIFFNSCFRKYALEKKDYSYCDKIDNFTDFWQQSKESCKTEILRGQ